jgi:hypothetical protein
VVFSSVLSSMGSPRLSSVLAYKWWTDQNKKHVQREILQIKDHLITLNESRPKARSFWTLSNLSGSRS